MTLSVAACGGATSPRGGGKITAKLHTNCRTHLAPPLGELAARRAD